MLPQNKHVGHIQGHVMELGLTMSPSWFCISYPNREFICFARGLIFEGSILTYDSITNRVEWVPKSSTIFDLSQEEEMSALALCNMVPHILDEGAKRLDRFGEHRDKNEKDGAEEAFSTEVPHEEEVEEETMDKGHKEEDEDADDEDTDDDDVDEEDTDKESKSHNSSESTQESSHSTHCYSDRHHHHGTSWAQQCKSENGEDGSFGELSVSENSEDERGGEAEHLQACHPPRCVNRNPQVSHLK